MLLSEIVIPCTHKQRLTNCWLYLADKLDGLQHGKKKHAEKSSRASMDEFLQVADEYFARQAQEPGKKRVNTLFLIWI